ncbi:MAG: tetratricopeptide repeat protein [Spirochaetaceae bacterium]|jgi:tetratricopeptide (TPR) repeat protein|nr:tetratricopeptide repeat protein [Spirochaetaceae bacterium]
MSREIGKKLYQEGDFVKALDQFLLEEVDPAQDGELAYYVGLCHTRLGDDETALSFFLRVLEIDFHILRAFQSRMVVAFIYNRQGEYDQAIHHLEELMKDGFESPQIFSSLGYAYWASGDSRRAIELYQRALDLDENNSTTLNSLGYILAEEGYDLKQALLYCQQALDQDPINVNYLDSMGWACFKSGRLTEAIDYLSRACQNEKAQDIIEQHYQEVLQSR